MNPLPLKNHHLALSPRMGEFSGWEMPLFYENAAAEHTAVREHAGIFDISHMGQVTVEGDGAEAFLDTQFTNDLSRLPVGRSHYSFLLNDEGGVIDDLLLYRVLPEKFFLIFNGARAAEAVSLLKETLPPHLSLEWHTERIGLALQGPGISALAPSLLGREIPLKRNRLLLDTEWKGAVVATTGYTGEHGFEWFGGIKEGIALWERALSLEVAPCGLVARDSLRLEAGLPLNGQDLTRETSPIQAGLGFAVKLEKGSSFRGKAALSQKAHEGTSLRGFTSSGPIPRTGYEIYSEGRKVGNVTSGGRPPGYPHTIGMAWIEQDHCSSKLEMRVRDRAFPVELVALPFRTQHT